MLINRRLAYAAQRISVDRRNLWDPVMTMETFVVTHDGHDRHVIDAALKRGAKEVAVLHFVHLIKWTPYSFLTLEELAERHKTTPTGDRSSPCRHPAAAS